MKLVDEEMVHMNRAYDKHLMIIHHQKKMNSAYKKLFQWSVIMMVISFLVGFYFGQHR